MFYLDSVKAVIHYCNKHLKTKTKSINPFWQKMDFLSPSIHCPFYKELSLCSSNTTHIFTVQTAVKGLVFDHLNSVGQSNL